MRCGRWSRRGLPPSREFRPVPARVCEPVRTLRRLSPARGAEGPAHESVAVLRHERTTRQSAHNSRSAARFPGAWPRAPHTRQRALMTCPRRLVRDAAPSTLSDRVDERSRQSFKPRRYSRDCPRAVAAPATLLTLPVPGCGFAGQGLSPGPTRRVVPFLLTCFARCDGCSACLRACSSSC